MGDTFNEPEQAVKHASETEQEQERNNRSGAIVNNGQTTERAAKFTGRQSHSLIDSPGMGFARKTWWDALLAAYGPNRETSFKQVTSDVAFLYASC